MIRFFLLKCWCPDFTIQSLISELLQMKLIMTDDFTHRHAHWASRNNNKTFSHSHHHQSYLPHEIGRSITMTAESMQSRQTRTSSWNIVLVALMWSLPALFFTPSFFLTAVSPPSLSLHSPLPLYQLSIKYYPHTHTQTLLSTHFFILCNPFLPCWSLLLSPAPTH